MAQQTNAPVSAIIAFSAYDQKGLHGIVTLEENNVIAIMISDDNTILKIENNGKILEGESYIQQHRPGQPIALIQLYEHGQIISSPAIAANASFSNFMLIQNSPGTYIWGIKDYRAADQTLLVQTKPKAEKVIIKYTNGKWMFAASDNKKCISGSTPVNLYLYNQKSRRFYTRSN